MVPLDTICLIEPTVGKGARLEYQPRHPVDVLATWAGIEILGWRPQYDFEGGVHGLWYQRNRVWAKEIDP